MKNCKPDEATRCKTTPEFTSRLKIDVFVKIKITFKLG